MRGRALARIAAGCAVALACLVACAPADAQMGDDYCTGLVCEGPESAEYTMTFPREATGGYDRILPVGVGDLTGDGAEEIAIPLPPDYTADGQRRVLVVNGHATGSPPSGNQVEMTIAGGYGLWGQVAGIGDLNGDGLNEVVVGTGSDIAVVYGRTDGATVDLGHLGNDGFRITDSSIEPGYEGGVFGRDHQALAISDLNHDGRDEVAFADGTLVRVFFPPAQTAGRSFDVAGSPAFVSTLSTDAPYGTAVGVAEAPELSGDGSSGLVVFTQDSAASSTYGITDLSAGEDRDIAGLTGAGAAFTLHAEPQDANTLGYVVGDENRDGRPDLLLWNGGRWFTAYSPDAGTDRTFGDVNPGQGTLAPIGFWNLGDLDGDGIDDTGGDGPLIASAGSDPNDPSGAGWILTSGHTAGFGATTTDTLTDENGDGVPEELATTHDWPSSNMLGAQNVRTFLSRPIIPITTSPAVRDGAYIDVAGSVAPTTENLARLRGAVYDPVTFYRDGREIAWISGGSGYNRQTGRFSTTVPATFAGYTEGGSEVTYRMALERDGKTLARGPLQSLNDAIQMDPPNGGETDLPGASNPRNEVKGTAKRDKLIGTSSSDLINAGRGSDVLIGKPDDDTLKGGPGDDRVSGSSGDDLLVGGPGHDVLRCGPGDDMAVIDGKDKLIGCETKVRLLP